MNQQDLIYGKSKVSRIVNIEINDSEAELFIQKEDGTVESSIVPNKFWVLSNEKLDDKCIRLNGDLHYKYGRQFSKFKDYASFRSYFSSRKDLYGIWDKKEAHMIKYGVTFFKDLKIKDVPILCFDLETTGKDLDAYSQVLLISNTFRDSKGNITKKLFSYDEYDGQADLIEAWCNWVQEINPSIIAAHNGYGFDFPYLNHVADMYGTSVDIGRDKSNIFISSRESRFRKDGSQTIGYKKIRCYGRELIDTMFLAIKYDVGREFESYGLKQIIKQKGLEKADRVFYDASQIRHNYKDPVEWAKIKQYCIDDGDDVLSIYDIMAPSFFYMTQSIPKSFQSVIESATGSQINSIMVRSYLQNGHSIPKADITNDFQGAISYGQPGVYSNCVRWDVSSLYPSVMRQYKVHDPIKDPLHYFTEITEFFSQERLKNKKLAKDLNSQYHDDLQQSQKILANSLYGFLSANGLNFNSPENASFITKTGREILMKAIKWASGNEYQEKV